MESQQQLVDVLILAQPSRMRDGLKAIVQALGWVKQVDTVEHWFTLSSHLPNNRPVIVIIDLSGLDALSLSKLMEMRKACRNAKCIAIIDRAHQRSDAQTLGADAILLRGFSTELLYSTMRTLMAPFDPNVALNGPLSIQP